MKVRIIKCSASIYWYADKIGYEYQVIQHITDEDGYLIVNDSVFNGCGIKKEDCEIIEEPKQIIDINGIQTEPFTHEEKKVIAVEKDIFKLEIWNLLLEKFKLANDLQRIAILEIFEETGYPESDMVKLYQKLANDTN